MKRKLSSSNGTVVMFAAGLVLIVLTGCIFNQNVPASATSSPTPLIPTMFIPTPSCGSPTLTIDMTLFQIQTIQLAPDGSVSIPAVGNGVVAWVEGTDAILVFLLNPTLKNQALISSLKDGSTAKAIWQNCNSMTFRLAAPRPGTFDATYLPDQSTAGINIYLQPDDNKNGLVVSGTLIEEQIVNIGTPVSSGSEIQAEISLLEITTSPDGATVSVSVSIFNFGQNTITLSTNDVSLTPQDASPLSLSVSEPALPKEITAAATETFYFTFPRPTTSTAMLKVFNVEYELEEY